MGSAVRWWLHHSLQSLAKDIGRHKSKLILRRGRAPDTLQKLAEEVGATTIHGIRHYEPWCRLRQ